MRQCRTRVPHDQRGPDGTFYRECGAPAVWEAYRPAVWPPDEEDIEPLCEVHAAMRSSPTWTVQLIEEDEK